MKTTDSLNHSMSGPCSCITRASGVRVIMGGAAVVPISGLHVVVPEAVYSTFVD